MASKTESTSINLSPSTGSDPNVLPLNDIFTLYEAATGDTSARERFNTNTPPLTDKEAFFIIVASEMMVRNNPNAALGYTENSVINLAAQTFTSPPNDIAATSAAQFFAFIDIPENKGFRDDLYAKFNEKTSDEFNKLLDTRLGYEIWKYKENHPDFDMIIADGAAQKSWVDDLQGFISASESMTQNTDGTQSKTSQLLGSINDIINTLRESDTYVDFAHIANGAPVDLISAVVQGLNPDNPGEEVDRKTLLQNLINTWRTLATLQKPDDAAYVNQHGFVTDPKTGEPLPISNDIDTDPALLGPYNHSQFAMYIRDNLINQDKPIFIGQNDVRTEFRQENADMQITQAAGWDMSTEIFSTFSKLVGKNEKDFNFVYLHSIDPAGNISEGFQNIAGRFEELENGTSIADSKYISKSSYLVADAMAASLVQYHTNPDGSAGAPEIDPATGGIILRGDMDDIMSRFNFGSFSRACLKTQDAFRVLNAMLMREEPYENSPPYVIYDEAKGGYRELTEDDVKILFSKVTALNIGPAAPAISTDEKEPMPDIISLLNENDLILKATGMDFSAYRDNNRNNVFWMDSTAYGELLGHADRPYIDFLESHQAIEIRNLLQMSFYKDSYFSNEMAEETLQNIGMFEASETQLLAVEDTRSRTTERTTGRL